MNSNSSASEHGLVSGRSLLASVLACLVIAGIVFSLVATPVAAHAYLSETDPGNGEQIDEVPEDVTLYFSGDGVVNADITIEGPDGEPVSGEPEIDADDTQIVHVPVESEENEDGMYTVEWEVLADDGHTTSGSFFFAVGDEPLDRDAVIDAHEDEEEESVSPIEAGAKGLLLIGVVGLIGIPATAAAMGSAFARTNKERRTAFDQRVAQLLIIAATITFVSALVLGLVRSTAIGPLSFETVSQFVETPLGQAWVIQLAIAGITAAIVVGLIRGLARTPALSGTFIGALLLAGTVAWTSHSATAIDRLQGTIVDLVHIIGAGLWIGGLAVLALAVIPVAQNSNPVERSTLVAATIRRFSVLALAGVTLVITTGLVLASWHIPTADGLTETLYGLTLVAKLGLIAVALGLGGATRFILLGRLESVQSATPAGTSTQARTDGGTEAVGSLRIITRAVRLELVVLVAVLLLSGLLTSAPTAAVAGGDDELVESTVEHEYDDGILEITAVPTLGDSSEDGHFMLEGDEPIVFEVAFIEDGDPIESEQPVRLLASSEEGTETEVELEETDDGTYATVQPLADEGQWELRVTGAPGGSYVSEWVDATVGSEGDHADHDHSDHEHNGHDHDGDSHNHNESGVTSFVLFLEFSAIVIALVGVAAVMIEGLQLRGRD
jgi:copper transport protein